MKRKTAGVGFFLSLTFLMLFLPCYMLYAGYTGKYTVGMTLPQLTFQGLTSEEDQKYLGVKGKDGFTLADISAKMICLEALSVL